MPWLLMNAFLDSFFFPLPSSSQNHFILDGIWMNGHLWLCTGTHSTTGPQMNAPLRSALSSLRIPPPNPPSPLLPPQNHQDAPYPTPAACPAAAERRQQLHDLGHASGNDADPRKALVDRCRTPAASFSCHHSQRPPPLGHWQSARARRLGRRSRARNITDLPLRRFRRRKSHPAAARPRRRVEKAADHLPAARAGRGRIRTAQWPCRVWRS